MDAAGIEVSGGKSTAFALRPLVEVVVLLFSGYMIAETNKFLCRYYDKACGYRVTSAAMPPVNMALVGLQRQTKR